MRVVQHTPDVLMLQPRRQGSWMLIGGLLFAVAGLVFVFLFGSTPELTCARLESDLIECQVRQRIFGLTLQKKEVNDLRGSKVVDRVDSDGDRLYRVVLTTGSGDVPLQGAWSSGYGPKEDFTRTVNEFVHTANRESLSVQESGGSVGLLFTGLFAVIGCVIAYLGVRALLTVWVFDRTNRVVARRVTGLGGARVTEYNLDDVVAVDVESHRSSDSSSRTYRTVLYLRSGERVPLLSAYSSGYRRKAKTAQVIREFLGLSESASTDLLGMFDRFLEDR